MANESSPICLRVPLDERRLLEVVAQYQGQTLSAFIRNAAVRVAQGIVDQQGAEAVFKKFETLETRKAAEVTERINEIRDHLLPQQHRGSPYRP
jgi:hypothetical protein